jgi:hypothetical protein
MPTTTTGGPSSGWEEPAYEGGEAPVPEPEPETEPEAEKVSEDTAEAAPVKRAARTRKAASK